MVMTRRWSERIETLEAERPQLLEVSVALSGG